METTHGMPAKVGIKIQKPLEVSIHPIYPILALLSLVLIGATAWLLVTEYLGIPPPAWLRNIFENVILAL